MHAFHDGHELSHIQLRALKLCVAIDRWRVQFRQIERKFGLNDADTKRRAFRWELAAFRFKSALLRYVELDEKAGFRRDQPRWPKGSGDDSGRWSGGGGTASPGIGHNSGGRPKGHHFVDRELFDDPELRLQSETRRVFEQATTGPLNAGPHRWSREHKVYNKAVREHFETFTKRLGITSEQMTPEQARKFLDEVKRSNDPRIRDF